MKDPTDSILKLDGISIGYEQHVVLPAVHLDIRRGSFTGLLGANGSGKSTLIKTILGILLPLQGRVQFSSRNESPPVFGYVPQREALDAIFLLSSYEVALMGVCSRVGPGRRVRQEDRDWVRQCLELTGAGQLRSRRFAELSGGQKQRVLIARALAAKPDLLLLDEPTSGIDVSVKHALMELLRRIHEEQGMTILMSSHDLPIVRQYTHHVVWLREGKILEGPPSELLAQDKMAAILDLEMN